MSSAHGLSTQLVQIASRIPGQVPAVGRYRVKVEYMHSGRDILANDFGWIGRSNACLIVREAFVPRVPVRDMNRRGFLALVGVNATAGCTTNVLSSSKTNSGPIANKTFTAYQPGSDFFKTAPDVSAPPDVGFDRGETRVRVIGKLFVGSSECNKAILEQATYDENIETLHVVVGGGQKQHSKSDCTMEETPDAYRTLVTFENELPNAVVATEKDGSTDNQTTAQNLPESR